MRVLRLTGMLLVACVVSPGPAERLSRAIEAVKLEVPIAAQFPLAQAAKAQERVEAGHILGKIVLRIG